MAVTKRLRFEIFRRDNHTCRYCGGTAPDVVLTVDHVIAVALGGSDDPSNLVTACKDCNNGKSATPAGAPLVDDVAQDALRWAAAMQRAGELAAEKRDRQELIAVDVMTMWDSLIPKYVRIPDDWERSINRFSERGLTVDDMVEAIHTTATKFKLPNSEKWVYFCGICHSMLRDRQEVAQALLREASEDLADYVQAAACDGQHPSITPEVRYGAALMLSLAAVCDGDRS